MGKSTLSYTQYYFPPLSKLIGINYILNFAKLNRNRYLNLSRLILVVNIPDLSRLILVVN